MINFADAEMQKLFISSNTSHFLSSIISSSFSSAPFLLLLINFITQHHLHKYVAPFPQLNSSHSPGLRNSGNNYSDQVHLIDPLPGHSPEIPGCCCWWSALAGDSLAALLSGHSVVERWLLAIVVVGAAFDCWQSAPKKDSGSFPRISFAWPLCN